MNIITALNKRYIPYTVVMLTSLGINNPCHIDAYLLHSELGADDISEIQSALNNYDLTVHSITIDKENFSSRLPRNEQWSMEIYYRLLIPEILPEGIERALYLDGDLIINKSLKELYDSDFNGMELIVCDDKGGLNDTEGYGTKNREMLAEAYRNGHRYFNSGVMLLNISDIRRAYSFQTYLDAIEAWNYEMEAPDQDILNWVHWKKTGYADCNKYNLFARIAHRAGITYGEAKEAAIIHFAGDKPWDNGNYHFPIEALWWDYAKQTAYYHKLLEDFMKNAMTDSSIENLLNELISKNNELSEALKKSMSALETLLKPT